MKRTSIVFVSAVAGLLARAANMRARADQSSPVVRFNSFGYWRLDETAVAESFLGHRASPGPQSYAGGRFPCRRNLIPML